jgi:hypothetical protein
MTQLRNTFDAERLGALESVLNDIDRELASQPPAGEDARPVISRERLAQLILHHAQDGESDPEKLRALVLKGIGRD